MTARRKVSDWIDDTPQEGVIYEDDLFVALTRPATLFGIPYGAVVLEITGALLALIGTNNPLYIASVVPMHGILYLISSSNPRIFNEIRAFARVQMRCRNRRYWKGASFSPRPPRRLSRLRQIHLYWLASRAAQTLARRLAWML